MVKFPGGTRGVVVVVIGAGVVLVLDGMKAAVVNDESSGTTSVGNGRVGTMAGVVGSVVRNGNKTSSGALLRANSQKFGTTGASQSTSSGTSTNSVKTFMGLY
jgi:hypothetical protein